MFKHLFTFLCDSSSVDDTDGKLSAYKLFESFTVAESESDKVNEGTILQFSFDLISGWLTDDEKKKPTKINVQKSIYNEKNELIAKISAPLELPAKQNRFNIRENIMGVPVKGFGSYTLELELTEGNKVVGKVAYPFGVVPVPEPDLEALSLNK
jgi:hypothetical protein